MALPLRIVLVEDDPDDAELLKYALKREGMACDVHQVANAAELDNALREAPPDVVICDFSLPQFDGFAALEMTLRACPGVPFFFCSGIIGEERARLALRLGATGFAEKGRLQDLLAQIKPYAQLEPQGHDKRIPLPAVNRAAHPKL